MSVRTWTMGSDQLLPSTEFLELLFREKQNLDEERYQKLVLNVV